MNWSVYVDEHYLVHGWNEQLVEFIYCTYKWILICCVILYLPNAREHYYRHTTYSLWFIAYGLWSMAYRLWFMVYGGLW